MTPKQKAYELIRINSLIIIAQVGNKLTINEVKELAEQFALMEVDEIIEEYQKIFPNVNRRNYWEEVKQEIENI
jgi:hypothetical protein